MSGVRERLDSIAADFRSVDDELRMEVLLDYARRLPPVPPDLAGGPDREAHRVRECMTPAFLWVVPEAGSGRVRVYAEVAEESPTVKGLVAVIVAACDGAEPADAAEMPDDLLDRLDLRAQIRMNRVVGLGAFIERVRRGAGTIAGPA